MKKLKGNKNPLVEEFNAARQEMEPQINALLAQAQDLVSQAEKLSDKYQIPFNSELAPFDGTYFPNEFFKGKFAGLYHTKSGEKNNDWCDDFFTFDCGEYEGWQHSMKQC